MPESDEFLTDLVSSPQLIGAGDNLITLREAEALSGLKSSFLKNIANSGRLQAEKRGRDWFTTPNALNKYLRSRHRGKHFDK